MATEIERYTEEQFDDILNETNPEIFGILPSRILSKCDPIMYHTMFSDFQEYDYQCDICGEIFDYEREAENCCPEPDPNEKI